MVTLLLILVVIVFAAAGLGKRFRIYSLVTVAIFIVAGAMTSIEAPNLAANLPTPTIGIWERGNIAASMLRVIVFALTLLRTNAQAERTLRIHPCRLCAISSQYCARSSGTPGGHSPHWRLPGTAKSMNFG
jgi:hypothetical protein